MGRQGDGDESNRPKRKLESRGEPSGEADGAAKGRADAPRDPAVCAPKRERAARARAQSFWSRKSNKVLLIAAGCLFVLSMSLTVLAVKLYFGFYVGLSLDAERAVEGVAQGDALGRAAALLAAAILAMFSYAATIALGLYVWFRGFANRRGAGSKQPDSIPRADGAGARATPSKFQAGKQIESINKKK